MELKVFRDVLPAAGADCTAKAELPLETELLISDYLPPVQRIVKCFAKPVVLQKQLAPGRLTLEGYLRCTVYYQGEEGAGLCQTEQKLPFTKALELPSFAATAWTACVEGQTEYLNCRAVNPRRIEVRGAYGLVVSVHAQLSTEVITALSEGGIEQKPVTLAGVRRAATLEKLVTIEGALTFPKPPAAILDITGTAEVRELKRMQGKAVAKGVLHVLCGWRAEGDAALRSQTADLPFNQILDADGLSEDCRCLCVLEPVGFAAAEGETTEDGSASTTLTATAMLRLSGWGEYKIRTALQRKRIDRELIDAALAQAEGADMGERLAQMLASKARRMRAATPYELKTKLIRYGLSLGYEYEAVLEAASAMVRETDTCEDF